MANKYDFSGWATKNDLKCADGRTIRRDAFKDCDGKIVPLVWMHSHDDPDNVLGHALLENRDTGVYTYCSFNSTEKAQNAKIQVEHGDIVGLSIYANRLKQTANGDVIHGAIREVSLVLAGANPGAYIDTVLTHSDEGTSEEGFIYSGENLTLEHAEEKEEPKQETKEEEPKAEEKGEKDMAKERTVQDVVDSMTEEQKNVMYFLIGEAAKKGTDEEGEEEEVKHNLFDNEYEPQQNVLSHSDMEEIFRDAKRSGSLKEAFLEHGIEDVEYLFPDAKNLTNTPTFINNEPQDWVQVVMKGVKHTPFSRIKMMFADIREDEARAMGYIKGNLKKEEVFTLLKRSVDPTTIYKLQKMDRDDVVDITDFDVVAWIKGEMRLKLDEEIARAILFGDGRLTSSNDHIDHTRIIPAISDAALYTLTANVDKSDPAQFIDDVVRAMDGYQGSAEPIAFLPQSTVTEMLLLKDQMGHRLYKTVDEIATAMTVGKIVKVPASVIPSGFEGLIVDLSAYYVGADKGGAVNMFEDFDIDYNKQKYLIETRCSGALTKPFTAVALKTAA